MQIKKSKKILLYFFLFLIIGSINNKNFSTIKFSRISEIQISGLDDKNNSLLKNEINVLNIKNLFFLKKSVIEEIINTNNLVEDYLVFKMEQIQTDFMLL